MQLLVLIAVFTIGVGNVKEVMDVSSFSVSIVYSRWLYRLFSMVRNFVPFLSDRFIIHIEKVTFRQLHCSQVVNFLSIVGFVFVCSISS